MTLTHYFSSSKKMQKYDFFPTWRENSSTFFIIYWLPVGYIFSGGHGAGRRAAGSPQVPSRYPVGILFVYSSTVDRCGRIWTFGKKERVREVDSQTLSGCFVFQGKLFSSRGAPGARRCRDGARLHRETHNLEPYTMRRQTGHRTQGHWSNRCSGRFPGCG